MAFARVPRFRSPDANVSGGNFFPAAALFDEATKARVTGIFSEINKVPADCHDRLKAQVELLAAELRGAARTNPNIILEGANQNFSAIVTQKDSLMRLDVSMGTNESENKLSFIFTFAHSDIHFPGVKIFCGGNTADQFQYITGYVDEPLPLFDAQLKDIIKSSIKVMGSIANYSPEKKTISAEDKKELEAAALRFVEVIKKGHVEYMGEAKRVFDAAAAEVIAVYTKIAANNPEAVREDGTLGGGTSNHMREHGHADISLFVPKRSSFVTLFFDASDTDASKIRISTSPAYKSDPEDHTKIFVDIANYLLNYAPEKIPVQPWLADLLKNGWPAQI